MLVIPFATDNNEVPPFKNLNIRPRGPSPDGVINIYACGVPVTSFDMFEGPSNWHATVKWLWDYGNERLNAKARREGKVPPVHKNCLHTDMCLASRLPIKVNARFSQKHQRTEKPMLRQVLHKAVFKAQHKLPLKRTPKH